jgi:hypothetical protein
LKVRIHHEKLYGRGPYLRERTRACHRRKLRPADTR